MFCCQKVVTASDAEFSVMFNQVAYSSVRYGIDVKISESKPEQLDLQVGIAGKIIRIDRKYLFGAKDIILKSVRLVGSLSEVKRGQEVMQPRDFIQNGFSVLFEFGGFYEHGSELQKSETKLVHKVVRLYFRKGDFVEAELAVPRGEFVNKWDIFAMDKGGKAAEKPYEVVNSVECPWLRGDN